jgi:hypothetical protein
MAVGEVTRSIEVQASILRLSDMKRRSKETQWKACGFVESNAQWKALRSLSSNR